MKTEFKPYPDAINVRSRSSFEILWKFQIMVELMVDFLSTMPSDYDLNESLRYKRLFFLRWEYRKLIRKALDGV